MAENPFLSAAIAKKDDAGAFGFMTPFVEGGRRALTKRGIGLMQLGMEGAERLGYDFPETYAASQRAVDKLEAEPQGGVMGFAGNILADPVTVAAAPIGLTGSALRMAGLGGGLGFLEGFTGGLGEDESRTYETIKSTAGGAALAPAAGKAMQAVGSVADPLVKSVVRSVDGLSSLSKGAIDKIRQTISNLDDDVIIGVKSGISADDFQAAVADISEEALKSFKGNVRKGVDPRTAYLDEVFKAKGGKMTAGQLGQDPNLQRLEDYARQGLLGGKAKNLARASEKQNLEAMRDWSNDIVRKFGIDPTDIDESAVGGRIATGFADEAARLKGIASDAFESGSKTTARVATKDVLGFTRNARSKLSDAGYDIGGMPTVQRTINQLSKAEKLLAKASDGTASYKPFEVYRKRLVQGVENASTPAEKQAMRVLRDDYTAMLEDVIQNKMVNGGDDAARELRKAPGLWRDYKQAIFGKDGKAALGAIVKKDMSDRAVAELFGSSAFGRGDTQKVVKQLSNVLGKESQQFGAVRGMFFNRLTNNAITASDDIGSKGFGVALKSNWQKMKTKDKALVNELYTPDQQRMIDDFVDAAFLQSNKIRSSTNPAGSAIALMDGWLRLMQNFGQGGGMMRDAIVGAVRAATTAGDTRTAIRSMTNAMKLLGNNSTVIKDALTAAGVLGGAQATGKLMPAQKGFESMSQEPNPFMTDEEINPFMELEYSPLSAQSYEDRPSINPRALSGEIESGDQAIIDMADEEYAVLMPYSGAELPQSTRQNEGLRLNVYEDPIVGRQALTVGYGFNMDSGIARNVWKRAGVQKDFDAVKRGEMALTVPEAEALGRVSYQVAVDDARKLFPDFDDYTTARQEAIADLSYQLGLPALSKFDSTIAAAKKGNWTTAARHLLKSKYAKQTPNRARRIARAFING